jgi:hypothetical protein
MTALVRQTPLIPLALLLIVVVVVTVAITQATQAPRCRPLSFEIKGTVVATTEPISFDGRRC